jgi:TPR repeat protein
MKLTLKRALAAVLLVLSFAAPVAAGPIENATAAYDRGDYATALRLLRPLADQGNAIAQSNLGRMYDKGQGVPQDFAEAVKWYRKAADQGLAIAQNVLGFMYDKGQGVPQDYAEAIKWFRKAADQGNAIAQTNLGVMYQ